MAASAEIITKPVESAISLRWIISARDDSIWFIGSVVSSYLLLFLYVWGIVPLIPMVAFWAILIDAPHVFGTFSRTYFDRTERQNRARLRITSIALNRPVDTSHVRGFFGTPSRGHCSSAASRMLHA